MADIFDLFKQIAKKNTAPQTPPTHMIVGLGNPGAEFQKTRHNAGYMAVEHLAQKLGTEISRSKFNALCADASLGETRVLLMKPLTFMNASGEAVRAAADFYKISPQNILVLVDDIYQDVGFMRVRKNGSDGGQRGLRSIIRELGTDDFPRIRFGVGKKPDPQYDLAAWVLGKLPDADLAELKACFPLIEDAAKLIFSAQMERAMTLCNGHRPNKEEPK